MNTVLFVGYVWPEPRSSAAGRRILDLISLFQHMGARVTFACAAEPGQNPADLAALGVTSLPIKLNCSSFDEQVRQLQPDAVVFDRFLCEEQFGWRVERSWPAAARIIDTEDLHCLRAARQQKIKSLPADRAADLAAALPTHALNFNSDIALREIAAIWRSDLSIMISPAEIALLVEHFAVDRRLLTYLPLLSQAGPVSVNRRSFCQREHCIMLGNFRHEPNWDALTLLRNQIWPALRQRLGGQVQCHIYGAYQPPKAQQLHSDKLGFLLKGWAENAAEVVAKARLCLAPLRFGAGQKGKLLEAMECATPSVTTSIGAEGMASAAHWPGRVADTLPDFIDSAVELYTDEIAWRDSAAKGALLLKSAFALDGFAEEFANKIKPISEDVEAHRQQFFYGLMIRQQRLRSEKFMSQWIEAKNSALRHTNDAQP